MPVYTYECPDCGNVTEAIRTIDRRHSAPVCAGKEFGQQCDHVMKLIITPVKGFVRFPAAGGVEYVSATTGRYIDTQRKREDDLKRSGCRPYEGFEQEKKEAQKRAAEEEKKDDAKLHEACAKAYYSLSPKKRAILKGE